ncbi:MAG: type 4a pilus biogenesis protein PilO [Betaproteobacteria bacterium]|nr:type 4a pilus biogenesis protein PilO [Betaproteobacteria bacterium]
MAFNVSEFLEDFKHLNPKDPGTWPALPKAAALLGLLVALLIAAYALVWQGQMDELDQGVAQESKLKDEYVEKKKKAINLDLHRQQLREIDSSFGALLKQLPNKAQMDGLLNDINQAGLGRGLEFELFRPAGGEISKEFYAELPISLKVTGNYHDIGAFASDVGQLSRIVTLNDVSISSAGKDGRLNMDATARTFRYLDDEEIAKQRQSTQAAKKAAKK